MKIDLKKIKHIYMIGVKGVGMTMVAQFLTKKSYCITGSDVPDTYMTEEVLKKCHIKIFTNFDKDNIPKDTDLIIYSTAYNEKTNTEVAWALKSKIPTLTYAQILEQIFDSMYGIAVTGSHGKTTTSAWLGFVMDKAGLSPSVMVGANVPQFGGTSLVGDSDYLVVEADEYQNKLQFYNPRAVLLNNIDYDHPDYFKTEKDYKEVFADFIQKIPGKGFLIANFDDKKVRSITDTINARVVSYAINESADYVAYNIKQDNNKQYFFVKLGLENSETFDDLGEFCIKLPGRHNISNALAVIATCIEINIKLSDIRTYLEDFSSTSRRMEVLGKFKGALIMDDYAHHPTEIRAALKGIKEMYPNKNIITVFHPHTFTRTKGLFNEFSKSFIDTDSLIILDIYGSAREEQGGVHSKDLFRKIKEANKKVKLKYIPTLSEAENHLRTNIGQNDIVLLMGAGDVFRIGENLLGK